jgi:hypothetical protein
VIGTMPKTAVLVLNHFKTVHLVDLYTTISNACRGYADVILLSDRTQISLCAKRYPPETQEVRFTRRDLISLGYPGKQDLIIGRRTRRNQRLGNAELPVLYFWRKHPNYGGYWVIEYDVRLTGSWSQFLSTWDHCNADLLGTTLTRYADCADWPHWSSIGLSERIDRQQWIRGFFPIYRISNDALGCLDHEYRTHNSGHMEALMPTLLAASGMALEDIGGDGPFVNPRNRNRFYTNNPSANTYSPGTFVYRPVREAVGPTEGMLWHPVKPPENPLTRIAEKVVNGLFR